VSSKGERWYRSTRTLLRTSLICATARTAGRSSLRDKDALTPGPCRLLDPHARQALADITTRSNAPEPASDRTGVRPLADGRRRCRWQLSWPEQQPRAPSHSHPAPTSPRLRDPHLQRWHVGDWPTNVLTRTRRRPSTPCARSRRRISTTWSFSRGTSASSRTVKGLD